MKVVLVLCVLVVSATCAPTTTVNPEILARRHLPALEHEEVHDEFGQYALRYVTAEGTVVSERGRLVPTADGKDYVLITEGEVSYIGDDGELYITKFTAGIDGYHVENNHQPIAPGAQSEESKSQ
ncbi:unnamed protein product [Leptosia nina]|uniref:Uncharacterized protein n=1 Tax=Leptosia nina TaxID=320188 RepID=A0AAV1JZ84_9NEOP